jgi:adenosine deaminase
MHNAESFIAGLPKAELHMHLEGSIEPELMLTLAHRNGIVLPWDSADALRSAYRFDNLQSFLDLYYAGCQVLQHEQDFYDMTLAYLRRARADTVLRAEVFLAPQNFTLRGIPVATVMSGVLRAIDDAEAALGISTGLIIIMQRHRTETDAFAALEQVMPWRDRIVAIGLGGAEIGNPPARFAGFFRACRERGFRVVVHAGEEGPAVYVREALELIGADRIDHGNACVQEPALVRQIAASGVPLTLCPISNLRLNVISALEQHPLRTLMEAGVVVTLNSDDPSYFGGYINANFVACREALNLSTAEIIELARNSFRAAFVSAAERQRYLAALDDYVAGSGEIGSRPAWSH